MQVVKLTCLLMDNGELLYMGRTIGYISENERAIKLQREKNTLIAKKDVEKN